MNSKNDFHVDLTDEQVAFFQENGYLSIPRITTDEEVEWLKGIYDELFTERTGEAEGRYFDLAGPPSTAGKRDIATGIGSRRRNSLNSARPSIFGTHIGLPQNCLM